jgi:hypothetical protein
MEAPRREKADKYAARQKKSLVVKSANIKQIN